MGCYYNKQYEDPRSQPEPRVQQMPPIKELNPRLLEAAQEQLRMMEQPEMSNIDSITITINKAQPEPMMIGVIGDPSQQMTDAYGEMLMQNQYENQVAQRAGEILKNELGVSPDGQYDLRYTSGAKRMRRR